MKILVFSDIHNDYAALERHMAAEADAYIAAGDLVSWARNLDRCGEILKKRGERVYVLPGNHESHSQMQALCAKYGLNDFHERSFEIDGWHVAGLGYSNPTPFNTPGEYSEEELARRLERFSALEPMILVCHCPPLGTPLDRIREGVHAGSRSVREFIERRQPAHFVCGHIHEAEGVTALIGRTRCVNAGARGVFIDA